VHGARRQAEPAGEHLHPRQHDPVSRQAKRGQAEVDRCGVDRWARCGERCGAGTRAAGRCRPGMCSAVQREDWRACGDAVRATRGAGEGVHRGEADRSGIHAREDLDISARREERRRHECDSVEWRRRGNQAKRHRSLDLCFSFATRAGRSLDHCHLADTSTASSSCPTCCSRRRVSARAGVRTCHG
jgi:hypothetical protein